MNEKLYYDESSPSGLRRKVECRTGKGIGRVMASVGSAAGTLGKNKNWRVSVDGQYYLAHRLVYCLMYGSIDEKMWIDHKDGNPENNHIENLRQVTSRVNSHNVRIRKCNKTGVKGIFRQSKTYAPTGSVCAFWVAAWMDGQGKLVKKLFSVTRHGEAGAKKMAEDTRSLAIEELNSLGEGYTDRHSQKENK